MDKLKIMSLNTHGLGDNLKRRKVFRYMKKHKSDVCLLQETHCTHKLENIFVNQWGNKCLFSNGSSNAKGVAILTTKKVANCISEVHRDINGRFLVCKIKIGEYSYCVGNIYAPNKNNPVFFQEIFEIVRKMDCIHVVIGSDYNVALDMDKFTSN